MTGRNRLTREQKTIRAMLGLYYQDHHYGVKGELCGDCRLLFDYAVERLGRCPFGAEKTVCSVCQIHCYKPEMREKVRAVMRYAGPRMMGRHPYLAIMHLVDRLRCIVEE